MPYLTIARITGDPDDLLDSYRRTSAVMDDVGRDHGLILHAGARVSDGIVIVNVWPAKECSESAAADPRRLAAVTQAGLGPEQQRKEHHHLERCVLFTAGAAAASTGPQDVRDLAGKRQERPSPDRRPTTRR
jgi:hypothetical protein